MSDNGIDDSHARMEDAYNHEQEDKQRAALSWLNDEPVGTASATPMSWSEAIHGFDAKTADKPPVHSSTSRLRAWLNAPISVDFVKGLIVGGVWTAVCLIGGAVLGWFI